MVDKARALAAERGSRRAAQAPWGHITRGTTASQRMRRVDRWLLDVHAPLLRGTPAPLLVDLGFGAQPWTAVEMWQRVRQIAPHAQLLGLEIDPQRVAHARHVTGTTPDLDFQLGGFEVPAPRPPTVIRAFNVLRQYQEHDVTEIWRALCARVAPDGVVIEGTCSEDGRRAAWVGLDARGPRTLTLAMRWGSFQRPSDVAERLPKALIHRHVPGERIHALLADADAAWAAHAGLSAYGYRQRWLAMAAQLSEQGWPVQGRRRQWRRGELTVDWASVAPETDPSRA
ncbi:MAG: class I SAM-dependent methyltransferase [Micrococcus sp.]|nr:class I SAM-dependent methyltransferase [Micrococcus sp.]